MDLAALDLWGAHHAFEFWTQTYLGAVEGKLVVRDTPAHAARLVCLRKTLGRPQVVGASLHLSRGAVDLGDVRYDADAGELRVTVTHPDQDDGRIFPHVPPGFALRSTDSDAAALAVDARRDEVVAVAFDGAPAGATLFRFRFDKVQW